MDFLQSEYGFISELGQFFIPKAMQGESEIQAVQGEFITLVQSAVEDEHIVLKHHKSVTKAEYYKIKKDEFIDMRAIDELGRVVLPKHHREQLNIAANDTLVCYLIDRCTIKIRRLVAQKSVVQETA